jgi:hypothetical protein
MPPAGNSGQQSDIRLASAGSSGASARRVIRALKKGEKESPRSVRAINRELDALQAEYQKRLSTLIGRRCLGELHRIRNQGAKLSRVSKERRALSALNECRVHRVQIVELRRPFLKKARDIIARAPSLSGIRSPHDRPCGSPFVTYAPPYGGWYWSYYWERTSNPRDPVIERYLESDIGRVGSRIRTSVAGADDDDRVYVEYQTGFNVWHTPQLTGPLEVQLTFAFTNAVFAGKVTDEWFWSDVTHVQFAEAQVRATDSQDPNQHDEALRFIDGVTGYKAGENETWSKPVANPFEARSYRCRTAATFSQGSPVLLQAGVRHVTRFETNDQSVSTNANIDLHLTRMEVRSCEPDIFL